LDFYQQGMSLAEIATRRSMRESTIFDHLVKLLECGYSVEIDLIVPVAKATAIEQAIVVVGAEKLTPIKAHLGDDYSYEEIKLVRARLHKSVES
jgi:ATP-dependent DNA helicase RecQ